MPKTRKWCHKTKELRHNSFQLAQTKGFRRSFAFWTVVRENESASGLVRIRGGEWEDRAVMTQWQRTSVTGNQRQKPHHPDSEDCNRWQRRWWGIQTVLPEQHWAPGKKRKLQ